MSAKRYGSADASEPTIALHWTAVSLCMFLFVSACIYTQYGLHSMSKRVTPALVGTVKEVDVMLFVAFIQPFALLIGKGANASDVPCFLNLFWGQTTTAVLISLFTYRILEFTREAARVNVTKFYLRYGVKKNLNEVQKSLIPSKDRNGFHASKTAAKYLRHKRILPFCIAEFFVATLLIFIDPEAVDNLKNNVSQCTSRTIGAILVLYYIFAIPYWCFISRFHFADPYNIVWKMKWQMTIATILVLCFLLNLQMESTYGTTHFALNNYLFWMGLAWTYWYTDSYLPFKETRKKLNNPPTDIKLVEAMVSPQILMAFEDHLLEEWSIENLEFYRRTLIFRVRATEVLRKIATKYTDLKLGEDDAKSEDSKKRDKESLRKEFIRQINANFDRLTREALKLYFQYVRSEAPNQVNIKAKNRVKVTEFFSQEILENARHAMSMASTAYSQSEASSVGSRGSVNGVTTGAASRAGLLIKGPNNKRGSLATTGTGNELKLTQSLKSTRSPTADHGASFGGEDKKRDIEASMGYEDTRSGNPIELQPLSPRSKSNKRFLRMNRFCKNLRRAAKIELKEGSTKMIESISSFADLELSSKLTAMVQMRNIFDDAQAEVFRLMETDSFRRFVRKREVRDLLQRV